jgi:hypothetical protein
VGKIDIGSKKTKKRTVDKDTQGKLVCLFGLALRYTDREAHTGQGHREVAATFLMNGKWYNEHKTAGSDRTVQKAERKGVISKMVEKIGPEHENPMTS